MVITPESEGSCSRYLATLSAIMFPAAVSLVKEPYAPEISTQSIGALLLASWQRPRIGKHRQMGRAQNDDGAEGPQKWS